MIREFSIQACSVWERWRSCPGTRAPAPGMPCPIAIGATPLQSSLSRSRRRRRRVRCGAVPGACTGELTGTMGFFLWQSPAAEARRGHAAAIPTRLPYPYVRAPWEPDTRTPPGSGALLPPSPRARPARALFGSGLERSISLGRKFSSVDLDHAAKRVLGILHAKLLVTYIHKSRAISGRPAVLTEYCRPSSQPASLPAL